MYVVTATDADSGTNGEVAYSLPSPVSLSTITCSSTIMYNVNFITLYDTILTSVHNNC